MPVEARLLEILCCPVSKTPLMTLATEKLDKLNAEIARGEVMYVNGVKVTDVLCEALVTEDMKVVYPVEQDIPILLEEKGIGTAQFQDL